MDTLNIWFLTGSQDLYGDDALQQVTQHIQKMVTTLNESGSLPLPLVEKPVQKSSGVERHIILPRAALKIANCISRNGRAMVH